MVVIKQSWNFFGYSVLVENHGNLTKVDTYLQNGRLHLLHGNFSLPGIVKLEWDPQELEFTEDSMRAQNSNHVFSRDKCFLNYDCIRHIIHLKGTQYIIYFPNAYSRADKCISNLFLNSIHMKSSTIHA